MRRVISTAAVLLGLAAIVLVGRPINQSIALGEPAAPPQVAPSAEPATDEDEPGRPADQAPEVDEAQVQAEQQAAEAEPRAADQVPQVDEAQLRAEPEGDREAESVLMPRAQAAPVLQPPVADDEAVNARQPGRIQPQDVPRQVTPLAPIFDANSARLSFQAVLTDNAGNALPGPTVDLQFQVYTSPVGVAVGAAINVCAVPIVNGVVDTQVPVPATSFDGTGREMGVRIDTTGACAAFGAELAPRIQLTAVPHAFRVNRVASEELDDIIALGDATNLGILDVHDGNGNVGARVDGDGLAGGGGQVDLFDETGSRTALLGSSASAGGFIELYDESGVLRTVNLDGDANGAGVGSGGLLQIFQSNGVSGVLVDGDASNANGGGAVSVGDSLGSTRVQLLGESTGTGGEVDVSDDDGTVTVKMIGAEIPTDGGQITIHNDTGLATIELDGDSGNSGFISVRGSDGATNLFLDGESGGAGLIQVDQNDSSLGVTIDGDNGVNGGGLISVHDSVSLARVKLFGESTGTGGEISVFDDNGTETVELLGAASTLDGGQILVRNNSGTDTLQLDGDSADAGLISIRNVTGTEKVRLDGDSLGAGLITLDQNDLSIGITLDGDNGTNVGGRIAVHDSTSGTRVQLLGQSVGTGGEISVFDDSGTETVEILGAETTTTGAQINLSKADGTVTISIDADFNADGRIITQELQITGGSDLSEQFDVQAADGKVEPGMVVCIDPARPGKLLVGAKAYDRTVAGIISGAGGVETGMYMGQRDSEEADGQYPVALTGRVYVRCDASQGAVVPGDMLTTSGTPGHAMKVKDHAKAQGAIIGKAMTALKSGCGLVLVLVTLQ